MLSQFSFTGYFVWAISKLQHGLQLIMRV